MNYLDRFINHADDALRLLPSFLTRVLAQSRLINWLIKTRVHEISPRVTLLYVWYDLFFGFYIDTKKQRIYMVIFPTIVFRIYYGDLNVRH